MIEAVLLDSGPLGRLVHADYKRNPEIRGWLAQMLDGGRVVYLPEIADFEVRRNLILENLRGSLANLDDLAGLVTYLPIVTADMRLAAELWARSRKAGRSVGDPRELNADVILAAQAIRARAVIATENLGHLGQFAPARFWQQIGE